MSDRGMAPTEIAEASPDPRIGTVVGERYRVIARIGEGGMGAVFRAEHILMKKVVALKLLHAEMGQVEEAARRFEREAQSASRLNHPHIVSVTDFGRDHTGELFLVMEFVAGESLADVLAREGRLSLTRACRLAGQILSALEHAHAQKVVHRDLKPANVMLVRSTDSRLGETAKILDFGIAKIMESAEGEQPLTKGLMIFGTPSYMSPEQATGQDVDSRSDLYSCGIILYEMLTGRKPFEAEDLVKLMAMQVTAPPPPFASAAPGVRIPAALESVVMRALEKERERRFGTAAEFREALERAEAAGLASVDAWARLGTAAGPALWAGLGKLRTALGWLVRHMAGATRALIARLPPRAQPWLKPAAAFVAVILVVALLFGHRHGAAPRLLPPNPRPVAQEMKSPIKQIESAMAKGHLAEARVLIMQQISEHPDVARVRYLLGNLEFADKNPSAGLQAYEEALRMDAGLRGDAALLVNARGLLSDKKLARSAFDLMVTQIGVPAGSALAEIASEDRRMDLRQDARAACNNLGCSDKVDRVKSYALDLAQAQSCAEKREAVQQLGATKDSRAIEPLRKSRTGDRGGFIGRVLGRGGNSCIIKDIDAALKELGVESPSRKKK
jgi:tRNA A-37 threonylcarbamoyl transferase component Bud32/tetratricopeptide (TPR) repeat protein